MQRCDDIRAMFARDATRPRREPDLEGRQLAISCDKTEVAVREPATNEWSDSARPGLNCLPAGLFQPALHEHAFGRSLIAVLMYRNSPRNRRCRVYITRTGLSVPKSTLLKRSAHRRRLRDTTSRRAAMEGVDYHSAVIRHRWTTAL